MTGRLARISAKIAAVARRAGRPLAALRAAGLRFTQAARRDARERPGRILRVALIVGLLGWVAATQLEVTADQQRLLSGDRVEARDLASIERETGTPGDVNVIVRSDHLLDPQVVRWMSDYQRRVLRRHGFRAGRPCSEAELCPALSLTNLFGAGRQSARQIRQAVEALPRYFSQNVITPDRRTANIAFRMGAMAPEDRRRIVDELRSELDPPAGVSADLAGPVVTAADGEGDVKTRMWLITLAALLVVAVIAGAGARSYRAAVLAAIPLILLAGWAFGILWALPVEADFLTTTLPAVVIAFCAGPVVLAVRGERELRPAALGAVAVVVAAAFLALAVADIPALRELGAAGAVALPLCALGLAVSVPATLTWAERRGGVHVSARGLSDAGRRAGAAIRQGVPRAGRKVRALASRR